MSIPFCVHAVFVRLRWMRFPLPPLARPVAPHCHTKNRSSGRKFNSIFLSICSSSPSSIQGVDVSVCVNAGPLSRSPHQPCFSPDRQLLIARTSVSVLNLPIEPSTNRLHTGNQSMMNIFNAIHLLVLRLRIGTGRHERWRHRRRTR